MQKKEIAPGGFEPPSTAPKAAILDRYTTGLLLHMVLFDGIF